MFRSLLANQQLLRAGWFKAQLLVEPRAVGGHQIHPLGVANRFGAEQGLHHSPAESAALKVSGNNHIPKHGAMDAIAGGPSEPHHALAAPQAHDNRAAGQHPFEICCVALLRPKRVFVQQAKQLEQAAARLEIRAEPKPAQAWGTRSMLNESDAGHGGLIRTPSSTRVEQQKTCAWLR